MKKNSFDNYLISRLGTPNPNWKDVVVNPNNEVLTFLLYSPDQRLVGYQKHCWDLPKLQDNSGRYSYYISQGEMPIFGLEYLRSLEDPILVVEGVFDALTLRRLGYQAISPLTVCPRKSVQKWIQHLPNTIAICDGDRAGLQLQNLTERSILLPEGEDCNSMKLQQLAKILKENI